MKADLETYLEETARHLQSVDPARRADMLLELQTHLEESMASHTKEEDPMKAVVAHMGSPALVGKTLARVNRPRLRPIHLILVSCLILIILAIVAPLSAQVRLPTYQYYDRVLSADDKLAFFEANIPLHCSELPSVERYVNERSLEIDYICFNTEAELAAYSDAVLRPGWERLAQEYPNAPRSRPSEPGDPNALGSPGR